MRLLGVCGGKGAAWAEKKSLAVVLWFYRKAWISFAPNTELVELLASRTGRPCYLMQRGIDSTLFSPQRRTRQDETFVLGYVGRLSPEKNVRQFAALERTLLEAGATDFRFAIVGDGSERGWLAKNLSHADLPGVQRGAELARLYANMDVFVFPSETDTFGNVVLEAQASGVPAVVTDRGGPKFLVDHGVNGFVGADAAGFGEAVLRLYRDRPLLTALKEGARTAALNRRWEPVFEAMYDRYAENHKTVTPDLRVGHRARTVPAVVASRSGCARRRPNMKVKKTVKHVEKAQGLLTAVLEKSDHLPRQVTELLRAATSTIEQAATALAEGDHSRTDDSNRRGAKKAARTRRPRSKAT